MRLATARQMREADRFTIEDLGIPGIALMESAGRGATDTLLSTLDEKQIDIQSACVGVFCGSGNNGGDGFVIARELLNAGAEVRVYIVAPAARYRGDAANNLRALARFIDGDLSAGRGIIKYWGDTLSEDTPIGNLLSLMPHHHIVVDALLGTGLRDTLRPPYVEIINHLNSLTAFKIAVDIPTGLCSDSGRKLGCTFQADITTTFALPKVGMLLYPGRSLVGEVHTIPIGIPAGVYDRVGVNSESLDLDLVSRLLSPREPTSHKGTFGHTLIIGGAPGKAGALSLAASSALHAGAGLVTAAGAESSSRLIVSSFPEIMTEAILTPQFDAEANLERLVEGKDTIAIGPGLGTSQEARQLLLWLLKSSSRPLVLDADAINLLTLDKDTFYPLLIDATQRLPIILTPHPGEFGRLIGRTARECLEHPLELSKEFAAEMGCYLIFKAAASLIAHPDGPVAINTTGNPGMATAGTGDVLTGLVASLLAQGHTAWDASRAAVYIHGLSGDIAARRSGQRSLIAGDLIRAYPEAFGTCE